MKLSFHTDDPIPSVRDRYPNGYWYAVTDDGAYDADGPDPLNALAKLVESMEKRS